MNRPRLIILAVAAFLVLSATAGLAASNLRPDLAAQADTLRDALPDVVTDVPDTLAAALPEDLLADTLGGVLPALAGVLPDVGGVMPDQAPDGGAPAEPEVITVPPIGPSQDDLLGRDGRLTVLVLGSDKRKGVPGERTDAMIVATFDPASGAVTMVSLPRDTVGVPIANGKTYPDRINALYGEFLKKTDKKQAALRKTREAISYAFDIEIDYGAVVDFGTLVRLVDAVGGVEVKVEESLVDPSMHLGERGLRVKKGTRVLDGKTALAFSRSRHADDDYARSRRQHQVLAAAVDKVRARGLDLLPALVALVDKKVVTDVPLEAAPALLELARGASLTRMRSTVLEPGRFARDGSVLYTIVPRISEVRKMFDRVLKPAR